MEEQGWKEQGLGEMGGGGRGSRERVLGGYTGECTFA